MVLSDVSVVSYLTAAPDFLTVLIITLYVPFGSSFVRVHEFFLVTTIRLYASPVISVLFAHTSYDTSAVLSAAHVHFSDLLPVCIRLGAPAAFMINFTPTTPDVFPVVIFRVCES